MKLVRPILFAWILFFGNQYILKAQSTTLTTSSFFADTGIVQTTIITDIKKLRSTRNKPVWIPAGIILKENDTSAISENISLRMRGHMRRSICDNATIELNFNTQLSPRLSGLKKMKLVGGCKSNIFDEELLLKEYLVYKMYNVLTPLSFKVRLLRITYIDSKKKVGTYTQYAFLVEDISDVAKRNGYINKKTGIFRTEQTDRLHISSVSIFEYMIGNTDWSVTARHNIRLVVPANDTLVKPLAIPYDFDYSGIVNAPYAVPNEEFTTIKSVRERLYRGFPRTMDELRPIIKNYQEKKKEILHVIANCYMLSGREKKDMIRYVEDFYDIIDKESGVKRNFSDNGRLF
ncbi:MAG: hypothetical protein LH478_12795 [Chitinophagaceae bacterium]|nr:hypothetical protein [Chitinophagaceae bacterium]